MKKTIGLLAALLVVASTLFAAKNVKENATLTVDTKTSKVYWTGKKVSGEHRGYLMIEKGTVIVRNGEVSSAEINMDLTSIVCTDLTNAQWNAKLVGHLKSDDFFAVDKYPVANFKITSMTKGENGKYKVSGSLNMKGSTHEISFPARVSVVNGIVTASGAAEINRTLWGIKYGSGKFFQGLGDNMISDNFEIRFELKTIEKVSLSLN